ncbi:hypothetical protein DL96DRAFT_1119292 [Flagelloscypha sp. PMI_526]|nr:hypothetical protein DL96DRAFT_1119292 [Flagelloscypha sp. PMI_526]
MSEPTILLLGGSGYIGGTFLRILEEKVPETYLITVLLRDVKGASYMKRVGQLKGLTPLLKIETLLGDLSDLEKIEKSASTHSVVINAIGKEDFDSTEAILKGLEKYSQNNPGKPPAYIHLSGAPIFFDNARGEDFDEATAHIWTDDGLNLNDEKLPSELLKTARAIVTAGRQSESPVRTIQLLPSFIYGVGGGLQKVSPALRLLYPLSKQSGFAGYWGAGKNRIPIVHVRDVGFAIFDLLKAASEMQGKQGGVFIYNAASDLPWISRHDWASLFGKSLLEKGVVKDGEARPFPEEVIQTFGEMGWLTLGGNLLMKGEKLSSEVGWKAAESSKQPIADAIPEEVEACMSLHTA